MKDLVYNTNVNAGKAIVWNTMLNAETYKLWVNAAWPDTFYEGEWKEGGNIRFISQDGSGTLANLTEYRPYKNIVANHIAVLNKGGIEDRDSDIARGWIGTREAYTFEEENGTTHLKVVLTINPEFEQMFNDGWPKALAKLKQVCEAKN